MHALVAKHTIEVLSFGVAATNGPYMDAFREGLRSMATSGADTIAIVPQHAEMRQYPE